MARFVVRRLILLVPILLGLSILLFVWVRALPGSTAQALLGERATPAAIAETASSRIPVTRVVLAAPTIAALPADWNLTPPASAENAKN